jgi:hypothetical protein
LNAFGYSVPFNGGSSVPVYSPWGFRPTARGCIHCRSLTGLAPTAGSLKISLQLLFPFFAFARISFFLLYHVAGRCQRFFSDFFGEFVLGKDSRGRRLFTMPLGYLAEFSAKNAGDIHFVANNIGYAN